MRNIKTAIAGLILLAVALISVPVASTVSATDQPPAEIVCYDQTPFQEWKFKKTVVTPAVAEVSHVEYSYSKQVETPKFKTEYRYQKQVKGIVQQRDNGTNEAWHTTGQSFDWEWWRGNTKQWSFQNVEVLQSGNHSDVQETWTTGNGNKQWRKLTTKFQYVKNGETRQVADGVTVSTEYSGWVKTPLGAPWVEIERKTIVTVEAVPESSVTLFYNGGAVSETDENIYGTNNDLDRSWVKFGERTNPGEPFVVECPTQEPKVVKTFTDWEDGTYECDDTTVTQTRVKTVTTTTYTWNGEGFDEDVTSKTKTQTRTRDLNEDEIETCPTIPTTTEPPATTVPETTVPETTVPPTVATSVPPVPTTAPITPAAGELPATGSTTGGIVGTGIALLLAGALAFVISRRKATNI